MNGCAARQQKKEASLDMQTRSSAQGRHHAALARSLKRRGGGDEGDEIINSDVEK